MKSLFSFISLTLFLGISVFIQAQNDDNQEYWIHTVQINEQLHQIANHYQVSVQDLKQVNGIKANYICKGQNLKIPLPTDTKTAQKSLANFVLHTLTKGDKLHNIAQTYKTSIEEIKRLNNIQQNTLSKSLIASNRLILIPNNLYEYPQDIHRFMSKLNLSGYLAAGFFMGTSWDGSKEINYSLNSRFDVRYILENNRYKISSNFNSSLGYRHEIGKYISKSADRFEFKNQINFKVFKNLQPFLFSSVRSQYFNTIFRDFQQNKKTTASLFAPAYSHIAIGLVYNRPSYNIDIGFYEFKTTFVLDDTVYGNRELAFGVPRGTRKRSEFGVSLRGDVYYFPNDRLKVEAYLDLFYTLKTVDFNFRGEFSYRFTKNLELALHCIMEYDKDFSEQLNYRNEMVLAYSFRKYK